MFIFKMASTSRSFHRNSSNFDLLEEEVEEPSSVEVLSCDAFQLAKRSNLSLEKAQELQKKTAQSCLNSQFTTADQIPPWDRLTTNCNALNSILNGGIPLNGITEIYGSSGVGKTQLLLQLALTIQLPSHLGGKEKGAIYVSTEDVFPSRRFHEMSRWFNIKYGLDIDFESNTYLEYPTDSELFMQCVLVRLPKLIEQKNIGLVAIDSIAGPFRSDNLFTNFVSRRDDIVEIADRLNKLVDKHNLVVICANQVTQDINTNKEEPCLGLTWSNSITYRLEITRPNYSLPYRTLKIIFAPDLPQSTCKFIITEKGVEG